MGDWHPDIPLLLVQILAVWRVAYALHAESGPWDALSKTRRWVARVTSVRVLDCFYCLSTWVALGATFVTDAGWLERAFWWMAVAGGAALFQRVTEDRRVAEYHEDPPKKEE